MAYSIDTVYSLVVEREFSILGQETGISRFSNLWSEVCWGISIVQESYHTKSLITGRSIVDYENVRNRIAYLYKYAVFHTEIAEYLFTLLYVSSVLFQEAISKCSSTLKICSIGGGPGSDIFGIIVALQKFILPDTIQTTVIDMCEDWKDTFNFLLNVTRPQLINCNIDRIRLVCENVLNSEWTHEVVEEIRRADIITMMKFISTISWNREACEHVLMRIFKLIKMGSFIVYIDNSGGRNFEIVSRIASRCGLREVIQPVLHKKFMNSRETFGIFSEIQRNVGSDPVKTTRVSFAVWQNIASEGFYRETQQYNTWY
ncbi:uncharacterized protein LOC143256236 [Tachypleus tridentatus]|uniref:uncharacterized protein LOC143256236 n=1 Tax=Tachypleus tridentatus TaxID=6853 RepID=UPI003FD32FFC